MPSVSPTTMQPVTPRWRMSDERSALNGLLMRRLPVQRRARSSDRSSRRRT